MEKGLLQQDSWAGRHKTLCEILKETPHRFLVRLGEDFLLPGGCRAAKGEEVYVAKDALQRVAAMETTIDERVSDRVLECY